MKVWLLKDEHYPVFSMWEGYGDVEMEVDPTTVQRWRRVQEDYDTMQAEMAEMFEAAFEGVEL